MAEDIAQQPLSGKEIRRLKEERREVWRKKKAIRKHNKKRGQRKERIKKKPKQPGDRCL